MLTCHVTTHKQAITPVPASSGASVRLFSFRLSAAEWSDPCFEPEHRKNTRSASFFLFFNKIACVGIFSRCFSSTWTSAREQKSSLQTVAPTHAHANSQTHAHGDGGEKETDLQVRGVEFVVARSQIGLQSLFGLVEVDTISAPVLYLGSQLLSLHAQFLQSALSAEQLENMAATTTPTLRRR